MTSSTRLTAITWTIGPLVDRGETETIDEIITRIEDRTLFDHLDQKYGDAADLSMISPEGRESLLDMFADFTGIDHRRKFGIERNGLMLLLAYAAEGIQQEFRRLEKS